MFSSRFGIREAQKYQNTQLRCDETALKRSQRTSDSSRNTGSGGHNTRKTHWQAIIENLGQHSVCMPIKKRSLNENDLSEELLPRIYSSLSCQI